MAGAKPAARGRKRVEATVLKRSRDGSAFTRCEACNKDVPVVLIDMHSCSLDSKIRMTLEARVVEKTVEINKTERKRPASSASKGHKSAKKGKDEPKRKRSPSAFFLFMDDFRKEYKAAHPDNKSVATVGKEGGEKWRSMTEEEKKPYFDKVAELKAQVDNGEGSGENAVAVEKSKADDEEEQEVDQPAKPLRYESDGDEDEVGDQKDGEKNELDDDM